MRNLKSVGKVSLPLLLCGALFLGLSACSAAPEKTQKPAQPKPAATKPKPAEEPPSYFPEGSAQDNLPYFTKVLQDYVHGEGQIAGKEVVDHLAQAGFPKPAMQVTADRTKTNLVADNIYVSVLIGENCLLGQLVTANREMKVEAVAAVGPHKQVCIIGQTRPIDW